MSEFKGTKGEWKYRIYNGRVIFDEPNMDLWFKDDSNDFKQEPSEVLANAKLIAAAPDMLEAAKEINRWLVVNFPEYGGEHDFGRCASFNKLRSAIRKALE